MGDGPVEDGGDRGGVSVDGDVHGRVVDGVGATGLRDVGAV